MGHLYLFVCLIERNQSFTQQYLKRSILNAISRNYSHFSELFAPISVFVTCSTGSRFLLTGQQRYAEFIVKDAGCIAIIHVTFQQSIQVSVINT